MPMSFNMSYAGGWSLVIYKTQLCGIAMSISTTVFKMVGGL